MESIRFRSSVGKKEKMIRKVYRKYMAHLKYKSQNIRVRKQKIGEWIEIFNMSFKLPIKNTPLSKEQKKEIDDYWKKEYGHKISKFWHRKYFAYSGKFDVKFFPEILYTTKLEPLMNDDFVSSVLSDKSLVEIIFGNVLKTGQGVVVPKTICGCCRGFGYDGDRQPASVKSLIEIVKGLEGSYIIKPSVGESSGHGVRLLQLEKGLDVRGKEKAEEILRRYGTDFIIQERIKQHEEYAALHPDSINTIRICTYRMEDQIKTMPAIMRIGVGESFLDNAHAGGIYVGISDEGILQKYALSYHYKKLEYHPDSQIRFEGYQVPYMKKMLKSAKLLHQCVPQIGFIHWDFSLNDKEEIVLIESNMCVGSIWLFQQAWGKGVFGEDTEYMINRIRKK